MQNGFGLGLAEPRLHETRELADRMELKPTVAQAVHHSARELPTERRRQLPATTAEPTARPDSEAGVKGQELPAVIKLSCQTIGMLSTRVNEYRAWLRDVTACKALLD